MAVAAAASAGVKGRCEGSCVAPCGVVPCAAGPATGTEDSAPDTPGCGCGNARDQSGGTAGSDARAGGGDRRLAGRKAPAGNTGGALSMVAVGYDAGRGARDTCKADVVCADTTGPVAAVPRPVGPSTLWAPPERASATPGATNAGATFRAARVAASAACAGDALSKSVGSAIEGVSGAESAASPAPGTQKPSFKARPSHGSATSEAATPDAVSAAVATAAASAMRCALASISRSFSSRSRRSSASACLRASPAALFLSASALRSASPSASMRGRRRSASSTSDSASRRSAAISPLTSAALRCETRKFQPIRNSLGDLGTLSKPFPPLDGKKKNCACAPCPCSPGAPGWCQ
mmetsp:Transcript_7278/g.22004  ORF Transcript_7278/g.22004 Transcript_7278/m.22004 type:complete len:351 (+) Transcript_7278:882-1934(+)